MKKRVFLMLFAAMFLPFAINAQVNSSVHIDSTIVACDSYTWSIDGQTYTTSGVHTHIQGDTLYILDLTINNSIDTVIATPLHGGCTFTWGDSTYHTQGVHTRVFQSQSGCDSTVTINLQLTGQATKTYTVTACESYIWKGDTLTATNTYNKNFTDTVNNCDSILTLNLTVMTPAAIAYDTTVVACEQTRYRFHMSQSWTNVTQNGYTMTSEAFGNTSTGRGIFHPRTAEKCFDSIVTVHFNIKKNVNNVIVANNQCDEYTLVINDSTSKTFTYSIVDTTTLKREASNGCDSLIILQLNLSKSPVPYITGDLNVAPGSSATLHANCDQENVTYTWSTGSHDNDITLTNLSGNQDVTLNAKNNGTGCEGTAYVTIRANVSIENVEDAEMAVYPNPTSAFVNITTNENVMNVSIYNVMGQQVMSVNGSKVIDLRSLNNGTYVMRVQLENGVVATRTILLSK